MAFETWKCHGDTGQNLVRHSGKQKALLVNWQENVEAPTRDQIDDE